MSDLELAWVGLGDSQAASRPGAWDSMSRSYSDTTANL